MAKSRFFYVCFYYLTKPNKKCYDLYSMQPIKILQTVLEQNADTSHFLFQTEDFYSIFPNESVESLHVLLSRAVKSGLLERVCKGIYLYPKVKYDPTMVLFRTVAKLRSHCMNYISLETVLTQHGIISQQMIGWLTVMTTGRSGIIRCGRFGSIEFIHTAKSLDKIVDNLCIDARSGMWQATIKLALQDMRDTKRPMELVDLSENELQ